MKTKRAGKEDLLQPEFDSSNNPGFDFSSRFRFPLTLYGLFFGIGVILVFLANQTAGASAQFGFQTSRTFNSGQNSYNVVAADFDKDGYPDLATANYTSKSITILRNSGSNTISSTRLISLTIAPTAVTTADFNNDGNPDLAVSYSSGIQVITAGGSGNYNTPVSYSGGSSTLLATADLNGDHFSDIVTVDTSNQLSVYLNNGAGGFNPVVTYPVTAPFDLILGDFNNDGNPDIVTANQNGANISLFLNNGSGGFGASRDFRAPGSPTGVTAADFNGDGKLDLVVANWTTTDVGLLLGDGQGGFQTPQPIPGVAGRIIAADFNNDGKPDYATSLFNNTQITVRLGDGSGGFSNQAYFYLTDVSNTVPYFITALDFNKDGFPEILTANGNYNSVSLWVNQSVKPAGTIKVLAGSPQNATVNTSFSNQLEAQVKDNSSNPLSGITVTFQAGITGGPGGPGGIFNGTGSPIATAVTGADGLVTAPVLTANCTTGSFLVRADAPTLAFATYFYLTNQSGPPAKINFLSNPQSAVVGTSFPTWFKVKVTDNCGNPLSGVYVSFSLPTTGPSATFSGISTTITAADGTASSPFLTANSQVGSYNLVARLVNNPEVPQTSLQLTNTTGSPSSLAIYAGSPQQTEGGTSFPAALQVVVKDTYSNPISGTTVTFTTPAQTANQASGIFSGAISTTVNVKTNSAGIATAPTLTANCTPGNFTVGAAVAGITSSVNFSLTNTLASASRLAATGIALQTVTVNQTLSPASPLKVSVRDVCGDPISGITVTFTAPATGPSGVFASGGTALSDLNGVAVAPAFTANASTGYYTVSAVAPGIRARARFNFFNQIGISATQLPAEEFHIPSVQNAGNTPDKVALADLNGDGRVDIVNTTYPGFQIRLANIDGSFGDAISYGNLGAPVALLVNDFTGDAVLDIGVVTSDRLLVYVGAGDGTFRTPVAPALSPGSNIAAVTGDFNGDNKLDIAALDGHATIYLGKGDGTFAIFASYNVSATSGDLTATDFNNDNKTDLAFITPYAGTSQVWLGDGTGAFPTTLNSISFSAHLIRAVDLNGDGKIDLIGLSRSTFSTVIVALGKGDGTFQTSVTYALPDYGYAYSMTLGDLNADGKPDIVVTNNTINTISLLFNKGDGSFRSGTSYLTGSGPKGVAIADFNQDGVADIGLTADVWSLNILYGNGNESFEAPVANSVGGHPYSMVTGDFNNDGHPDLAADFESGSNLSVYLSIGMDPDNVVPAMNTALDAASYNIKAADLDGDGNLDLVLSNLYGSQVRILLGKGDGTFQNARAYATGSNYIGAVEIGDFNNDGILDLAVQCGNTLQILFGKGDGSFQSPVTNQISGYGPDVAADFNQDGFLDLAVSQNQITIYLGKGDGTFQGPQAAPSTPYGTGLLVTADFDADNIPDLFAMSSSPEMGFVFVGKGDGTLQTPRSVNSAGGQKSSLTLGDFNGDGRLDVAAGNIFSQVVSTFSGTGAANFQLANLYNMGNAARMILSNDLNGDGRSDLIVGTVNYGGVIGVLKSRAPLPAAHLRALLPLATGAGQTISVTVKVTDRYDAVDTHYSGTIHFSSSDTAAVLPGDYTFVTADNGVHTFTFSLNSGGEQILTLTDTANAGLTVSPTIAVASNIPATLTFLTNPSLIAGINTNYAFPFKVVVKDSAGRPVRGALVLFGLPTAGPGGFFYPNRPVLTGADGIAVSASLRANSQIGSFQLTASLIGFNGPQAASLELNNLENPPDCNPLLVTLAEDNGTPGTCGSLSNAITAATGSSGVVTITFSPAITSVNVTGELPELGSASGIVIDGGCTTAPGPVERGEPGVEIVAGGGGGRAFHLSGNVTLSGLKIGNFNDFAVTISGSNNHLVCSWLGTFNGSDPAPNLGGIKFLNATASENYLGLAGSPLMGNVISGNSGPGILVQGGQNNWLYQNWIGLQPDGQATLKNGGGAVKIEAGGSLKFGPGNRLQS